MRAEKYKKISTSTQHEEVHTLVNKEILQLANVINWMTVRAYMFIYVALKDAIRSANKVISTSELCGSWRGKKLKFSDAHKYLMIGT